jgi:uncharacterized caspase-like protein
MSKYKVSLESNYVSNGGVQVRYYDNCHKGYSVRQALKKCYEILDQGYQDEVVIQRFSADDYEREEYERLKEKYD